MLGHHIVAVPPAGDGAVVVVEVQQQGSHPLDVRLVGCEGENPYVTTIKHRNLGKLKHKFKGSDDDWEAVLAHFLLQNQPKDAARLLDGVRMVYAMEDDDIKISIRRDVQGIKVTLGEILLPRKSEYELDPFEWAQVSAQAHSRTLQEMAELQAKASGDQDTIAKLNAQLDDLIKTKIETETAMLQQFMGLLNEKKRKIRDQSRLLAGAQVDKTAALAVQSAREETKPRKASTSRTSKRKAAPPKAVEPEPQSQSDSDQMEADQAKVEHEDDENLGSGATTPDRSSDAETEEEDEDEVPSRSVPRPRSASKDEPSVPSMPAKPLPPRRELPFGRPSTRSAAKAPTVAEDEGTEDEEL